MVGWTVTVDPNYKSAEQKNVGIFNDIFAVRVELFLTQDEALHLRDSISDANKRLWKKTPKKKRKHP